MCSGHTSQEKDTGFIAKRDPCLKKYVNIENDGSLDDNCRVCIRMQCFAHVRKEKEKKS